MNKVMLIGRLGRDPELRYSSTGTSIANLRIATDEGYTDRDGNKVDRTEWHTVVVFQRQAENCATYLRKGSLVFVEGSLQTRKWQDQQGQDRYITEVKASRVQFLDRRGGTETDAGEGIRNKQPHETLSDFDHAFPPKGSDKELGKAFAQTASEMDYPPWDRPPDMPF